MISKKIILVLASRDDIHADAVIYHLNKMEQEVVRIDPTDFWPENSKLVWNIDNIQSQAVLIWNGRSIEASQVSAVFNREFGFAKPEGEQDIGSLLKYAEARAALFGFFRSLENVYWMNPPWHDEMVDNKPYQYACATSIGLKVPKTLITNDPKSFLNFYEECDRDVIVKQLSEVCLIEEVGFPSKHTRVLEQTAYGFFTNKISSEYLKHASEISTAPCLFQKHVPKKGDIRVTVVGDRIFSMFIDSQSCEKTKIDFRHEPFLQVEEYSLPAIIETKLLKLMRQWKLQFAACDFVLTPTDELIFLEANVVGNWLWLTLPNEDRISVEIANNIAG